MIPVKHEAVEVDFDDAQARLRVRGLNIFDDHDLANSLTQGLGIPTPPIPGVFPVRATVSFDVEWEGTLATAQIENNSQRLRTASCGGDCSSRPKVPQSRREMKRQPFSATRTSSRLGTP